MYAHKILIILLLFCGVGSAYNVTTGLEAGEIYYYTMYSIDENNALNHYITTPDGTYIYDGWDYKYIRDIDAFVSWYCYYAMHYFSTDAEVSVRWELITKVYNETTAVYEDSPTDTTYVMGYVLDTAGGASASDPAQVSITSPALPLLGGVDIVEEYFINDTTRVNNFNGTNIRPVHPDYVEVKQFIGSGMVDIERIDTYGITMTHETAKGASEGVSGLAEDDNAGFSMVGRGAGAGGGSIYEGIGLGGGDGAGDMKDAFNCLFYALIPLIFIICIIKMSVKMFKR